MLQFQILILTTWMRASAPIRRRIDERDRGEITSTTALIVLLVVAAIAAGGVIAAKIAGNANAVPSP
ncbi:MAG: hypothetical protein JWM34_3743 [Ilumatobacteraceae bacterium]|nr:hypothetical protein [Ilumatobacteraceae bacterium]